MKNLEEVLGELGTVERAEVLAWVEASWVRPDPDVLTRLRFQSELVDARADRLDQIGAPDEHTCPRTGDVLVRRADGEVDISDLEGARLLKKTDP